MKYKQGDRVKIKSLDWYNKNKDEDGNIELPTHIFTPGMSQFCGKVMTIEDVFEDIDDNVVYYMEEIDYDWTDEMIEGLVEDENKFGTALNPIVPKSNANCLTQESIDKLVGEETLIERVDDNGLPFNEWLSHKGAFHIPDGYELKDENGNIINARKIVLEEKKKEYPKSFGECCKVLGTYSYNQSIVGYKNELFSALQKLIICRDAYWKIAGEEMGLGKPWTPDWADTEIKYCIANSRVGIKKSNTYDFTRILAFPTEEMQDTFHENFRKEIEICKELL